MRPDLQAALLLQVRPQDGHGAAHADGGPLRLEARAQQVQKGLAGDVVAQQGVVEEVVGGFLGQLGGAGNKLLSDKQGSF